MAGFLHDTRSTSLDLTWKSPKHNHSYLAGHVFQAEWTAKKSLVSPSFRLCVQSDNDSDDSNSRRSQGDDDDCGDSVWPSVEHDGDSYTASLMAPNITEDQLEMYLQLRDDFGKEATSPLFTLSSAAPASSDASTDSGSNSTSLENPSSNSPTSKPSSSAKKTGQPSPKHSATNSEVSDDKADPSSSSPTVASDNETADLPVSSPTSPASDSSGQPDSDALSPALAPTSSPDSSIPLDDSPQSILTKPSASSVAILAVPLSLLGLILVASSILACHHHRSMVRARNADRDRLERSASFVAATAALKTHESLRAARIEVPRRVEKRMELDDIVSLYEYEHDEPPARWVHPDALGIYHPTWGAPGVKEGRVEKEREVFDDVPLTPRLPRSNGFAAGLAELARHDSPLPPPPALIPGVLVRPRPR
ncbi:hypothetical protein CONPUDRAFT_148304 [Coniophora puteana RWD-64-598 SS2]|uniref:Uncharacterized protein n=1 Tax=Coniophora puteana (strain RWD-64-598) TaxID=741705 RepID=A0A5M3N4H4_CONPW|nr:uncharacterized protein CONPUDRAFT_148304 [Coniophora puteana RWD-64-598 SS2]EIW86208.1 hypothetical protein CONPUDRAFT_148304 [Coniophora puteana RWD-64-598 SS2]